MADFFSQMRNEGGFFRLPPSLVIKMTGNDRLRYLNGQITADVRKLAPGEAMQACLLTPKGKLLAVLSITAVDDALLIESDISLSEALRARLEQYIIADDVALEVIETSDKIHFFGSILDHPILKKINGTNINRLGMSGKDVDLVQLESLIGIAHKEPLSAEMVEAFRIAQGIPRWGYELETEMLPQEARLERTHIDDQKGCYVGQEIVSRLKSIGHVNRILCSFVSEEEIPLTRGMELFSEGEKSQQVGVLTSVAKKTDGNQFIALGYLKRGNDIVGKQLTAIDPATEVATHVTVASFPI